MAATIWEWSGEKKGPKLATGNDVVLLGTGTYGIANVRPAFAKNDIGRNYYIQDGILLRHGKALKLTALPGEGRRMTTFDAL